MWPVSSHYLATLARSHQQTVYLEVLKDGQVIKTLQAGEITDPATGLPTSTIGGKIDVSKTTIRRAGTVTFLDASGQLLPESVADLFAPYVTELRVWAGVRYWDAPLPALATSTTGLGVPALQADTEFVPVATLVITELESAYPQITITGSDRMWLLGSFTAPYTVASGTETVTALSALLAANIPDARLATNFLTQGELTTPALMFDAESSIADAAHSIAQTAGWQLYVDPAGTFTLSAEPSTDDDAVFSYAPGQASVMMRPRRTVGGDMYNAVVFTGEGGSTSPVRGYAQDDDPTSLTYVGRVGTRPYFASSPLVTTSAQAALAAKTTLQRILGVADTIAVPVVPNHALECGDVVHVTDPLQQIDADLIIDSFTVPLRASDGAMELTCRSRVMR